MSIGLSDFTKLIPDIRSIIKASERHIELMAEVLNKQTELLALIAEQHGDAAYCAQCQRLRRKLM